MMHSVCYCMLMYLLVLKAFENIGANLKFQEKKSNTDKIILQ